MSFISLYIKNVRRFSKSTIEALLIQNVENLGFEGEIVKVKPGYLEKFLIPRQLGIYNFPPGIRKRLFPNIKDEEIAEKKKTLLEAETFRKRIENIQIEFNRNESFTNPILLKDPVTMKEVLNEVKNKYDIEIDQKNILEDKPYFKFGNYSLKVIDYYNEKMDENFTFLVNINLKKIILNPKIAKKTETQEIKK